MLNHPQTHTYMRVNGEMWWRNKKDIHWQWWGWGWMRASRKKLHFRKKYVEWQYTSREAIFQPRSWRGARGCLAPPELVKIDKNLWKSCRNWHNIRFSTLCIAKKSISFFRTKNLSVVRYVSTGDSSSLTFPIKPKIQLIKQMKFWPSLKKILEFDSLKWLKTHLFFVFGKIEETTFTGI